MHVRASCKGGQSSSGTIRPRNRKLVSTSRIWFSSTVQLYQAINGYDS
jgi:hypothetical protein